MAAKRARRPPRWGILGAGGISNDFAAGLVGNGSSISAVAARDANKAQDFAQKFGAARAHGSYEALVADADVDVVYVGTIHTMHAPHTKMALEAGKHVVCEKPLGINEQQVQELIDLARSKNLFLVEAMWTRFFPAVRKAREVLASGEIGSPRYVQSDFGFVAPPDETHRLWDPQQAGGAMLDIGCYVVSAATMAFGATLPQQISCTGQLADTGVDKEGSLALTWEGQGSASLLCSLTTNTPEQATVICSKGHLRLHGPAHCPLRITVSKEVSRGNFEEETFAFDLPKAPDGIQVNYPHSEGFLYEVQGVEKALQEGLLECPEFPLEESLVVVRIMDAYRKQLGVVYPLEK